MPPSTKQRHHLASISQARKVAKHQKLASTEEESDGQHQEVESSDSTSNSASDSDEDELEVLSIQDFYTENLDIDN